MTTATTDDLVGLQERHRQLADRVDELRNQSMIIRDDIAVARQDWADAVELGDDVELLASRVRLREGEAEDNQRAIEHLAAIVADLDRQITDVIAREQLADDESSYRVALDSYAEGLPGLPDCLPAAVELISDALTGLLAEVDAARTTHDQLAASAGSLHQRADLLGADIDAPQPPSWSDPLERAHDKESATRQLMLAVVQRRGAHAVLSEIERLIQLDLEAKRRALR
jgi:hypothetical protein